jgi:single-stranded DNA-binding protein
MQSQIYLHGRLSGNPEIGTTRKGAPWVRILLETKLVRADGRDGVQTETVLLPISCFSREAEAVKSLRSGDELTAGVHLYSTQFQLSSGELKRGIILVADAVLKRLAKKEAGV